MPAHVTVMFPFLKLADLTREAREHLEDRLARVEPFHYEFKSTAAFPDVLYLKPEDEVPFLELTALVRSLFPELAPYGDPRLKQMPHLTVAHAAGDEQLRRIRADFEDRLRDHGPVTGVATAVSVLEHSGSAWTLDESLKLGEGVS
jgi:2'-5' RNA ligase